MVIHTLQEVAKEFCVKKSHRQTEQLKKELTNQFNINIYFTAERDVQPGEFVPVRVTGIMDGDLTGEVTEEE